MMGKSAGCPWRSKDPPPLRPSFVPSREPEAAPGVGRPWTVSTPRRCSNSQTLSEGVAVAFAGRPDLLRDPWHGGCRRPRNVTSDRSAGRWFRPDRPGSGLCVGGVAAVHARAGGGGVAAAVRLGDHLCRCMIVCATALGALALTSRSADLLPGSRAAYRASMAMAVTEIDGGQNRRVARHPVR